MDGVTVCPGVQTTMPDNRDRRRASLSPGQVILVIMAIFVLLIFAWGLHSINSPALVCAVRPANMRVKNEERVGNPKREYRASGCNDGGVLPHSKCRQARPYRVANQPSDRDDPDHARDGDDCVDAGIFPHDVYRTLTRSGHT